MRSPFLLYLLALSDCVNARPCNAFDRLRSKWKSSINCEERIPNVRQNAASSVVRPNQVVPVVRENAAVSVIRPNQVVSVVRSNSVVSPSKRNKDKRSTSGEDSNQISLADTDVHTNSDKSHRGAVASEHKICSQIGIDLLRQGGNAADAAVGTAFCVGVVAPYHSGIGGGSFALVRKPDTGRSNHSVINDNVNNQVRGHGLDRFQVVDYREVAPDAAHRDMYKGRETQSLHGALSVAVPGEVRGLAQLHAQYGSLAWSTVLSGAIRIARQGFKCHQALHDFMVEKQVEAGRDFLLEDPSWAEDFAPHGKILEVGDIVTQKRLADTLEKIAENPEDFYKGGIAKALVRTIQAGGGIITENDLADYSVQIRPALEIEHRGYRVVAVGAPASGAVTLSALNIIGGYNDTSDGSNLNTSYHRLMEAFRFAYSQRTLLGDPDFVDDMDIYQGKMLNTSTAAQIRSRITFDTHQVPYYNPDLILPQESQGTSHIVVADASGLSISLTSTINNIFGSLVRCNETGIILNNEMNDFSIPSLEKNLFGFVPSPANYIQPRKRPFSSMTPVIVEHALNGSLVLLTGAAGGSRIITATTQYLWHELDRGLLRPDTPLSIPLGHARLHDQLVPFTADFETDFEKQFPGVIASMKERGHNVTTGVRPDLGRVAAIRRWHSTLQEGQDRVRFEASADPRQPDGAGFAV